MVRGGARVWGPGPGLGLWGLGFLVSTLGVGVYGS